MSPRTWKERIEDILEAIAEACAFTSDISFDNFKNDPKTLKAVALNLVIIGESAAHVPDDVAASHPEIAWRLMRGIRNRLVHDYFSIDAEIIWETVQNDLPPLVKPLQELLRGA